MLFRKITKLTRLSFSRNDSEHLNAWNLTDLHFNGFVNIVTGKNSSGKSRTARLIQRLAKAFNGQASLLAGSVEMHFRTNLGNDLVYKFNISNVVTAETIMQNGHTMLSRTGNKIEISLGQGGGMERIDAAPDKLSLHEIDAKYHERFPFIEDLVVWAKGLLTWNFDRTANATDFDNKQLTDIQMLTAASASIHESLIQQINELGFDIRAINLTNDNKNIAFVEHNVNHRFLLNQVSDSLCNIFQFLLLLQHVSVSRNIHTLVIDNFARGIDNEQAIKLMTLLNDRYKNAEVQINGFTTENAVVNAADMRWCNFLVRHQHNVYAINYENNKQRLENFRTSGTENAALLYSGFVKKIEQGDTEQPKKSEI